MISACTSTSNEGNTKDRMPGETQTTCQTTYRFTMPLQPVLVLSLAEPLAGRRGSHQVSSATHSTSLISLFKTMKTIDLLSCPEATLTLELKLMKSKELERHTRKLLMKLGLNDYDAVMATVIKAIPKLDTETTDRFSALQALINSLLVSEKHKVEQQAVVERLAIVMMLLVAKKFHKIHTGSN